VAVGDVPGPTDALPGLREAAVGRLPELRQLRARRRRAQRDWIGGPDVRHQPLLNPYRAARAARGSAGLNAHMSPSARSGLLGPRLRASTFDSTLTRPLPSWS